MQASILSCKCCNGNLITDIESGEIACGVCGQVSLDRMQESRPEWSNFDSNGNIESRAGPPASLAYHDMGLATTIGRTNRDSTGHRLAVSMNASIQRLRTWDLRTKAHSPGHRNLIRAFSELGRLRDKLGLSDSVMEKTAYVYRKAHEKGLVKGRSTSSFIAAAVYVACREMDASRTLGDIAKGTGVKRTVISRSYRLIVRGLEINIPLADPMKCIARIANKANLSEKTKRTAMSTMTSLIEAGITAGKLPMGLAATVLYISCIANGESKTQSDIAEIAGITEVTLRNRFKDISASIVLN